MTDKCLERVAELSGDGVQAKVHPAVHHDHQL